MKGRKMFFSVLLAILMLSACSPKADSKTEENTKTEKESGVEKAGSAEQNKLEQFRKEKLFASELPDEDLPKPGESIASVEDMIYALDYMAFYRIGDEVFFLVDPGFAKEIYNPYTVYQEAYRRADLADVYACRLDDTWYSDYGVVGLKYSMSRDIASEPPASVPEAPVIPSFDYEYPSAAGELLFATDKEELPGVSCENGEQLYYLAMNGYRPDPVSGSIAEELYADAKEILNGLVPANADDFQKIRAVYDWLTTEVKYDAKTAYTSETYLVREQAYYLEGVFLNRCAVCDGKAKACALMLNMLGVLCFRTTGVNEGGDHAWNMVCLDGKWYNLCTTYGQSNMTESLGRIVPNYTMLLAGAETPYEWYPADKHLDIEAVLEEEPYDIFTRIGEEEEISLRIANLEELQALLQKTAEYGKREYKIEFEYSGAEKESFIEEMTDFLAQEEGRNAAELKTEGGSSRFLVTVTD